MTEEMTRAVRMAATNTAEAVNHPSGRTTTAVRWATRVRMTEMYTAGDTDHLGGRRPMMVRLAATGKTVATERTTRAATTRKATTDGGGQEQAQIVGRSWEKAYPAQ